MISVLLTSAFAGDLGDLARLGEPAAVITCHSVEAFEQLGRSASVTELDGAQGPVHMVVLGNGPDRPGTLWLELMPSADVVERAAHEEQLEVVGDRVRLKAPFQPMPQTAEPSRMVVRALGEDLGEGCAGAVVVANVPLLEDSLVAFAFTGWQEPLRGSLDWASGPIVGELLDGVGEGPLVAPRSVHEFESAFQLHGTLPELALAAASIDPGAVMPMLALASAVPRKIEIERGAMLGLDGGGVDWAAVIPLARPASAKRQLKLLRRMLERADLPYTEIAGDRVRVTPLQGPTVLVGLDEGRVVLSTRDDVVQDVLADAGEAWMAPADGPYGLRARTPNFEGFFRTGGGVVRFELDMDPAFLGPLVGADD